MVSVSVYFCNKSIIHLCETIHNYSEMKEGESFIARQISLNKQIKINATV